MRILVAVTVISAVLLLHTVESVTQSDSEEISSTESADSSESFESGEATESTEFSTTTEQTDVAIVTHQTLSKTPVPFGPLSVEKTTPSIEIKVNELSVVLKRTIHRIREKYKKIDVVFLLDASSSVGKNSFISELKFVRKFLSDFNVSYNYTRVSLVTFSSQGKIVSTWNIVIWTLCDRFGCHFSEGSSGMLTTFRKPANTMINANCCTINYRKSVSLAAAPSRLVLWRKRRFVYSIQHCLLCLTFFILRRSCRRLVGTARNWYVSSPMDFQTARIPCRSPKNWRTTTSPSSRLVNTLRNPWNSPNLYVLHMLLIGIQTGNYGELHNISSDPGNEHSFLLDSFSQFESLARKALHTGE